MLKNFELNFCFGKKPQNSKLSELKKIPPCTVYMCIFLYISIYLSGTRKHVRVYFCKCMCVYISNTYILIFQSDTFLCFFFILFCRFFSHILQYFHFYFIFSLTFCNSEIFCFINIGKHCKAYIYSISYY